MTAEQRIRKFLDEYKLMKGVDPENIWSDPDRQASITVSDLEELLSSKDNFLVPVTDQVVPTEMPC